MKPLYVILEYGVGERTLNPTNSVGTNKWFLASSRHMTKIAEIVKLNMLPLICGRDYDIVSLPLSEAPAWLESNWQDVYCLSASVGKFISEGFLRPYYDKFLITTSSGNEGKNVIVENSMKEFGLSIGAIDHRTMKLTSYSSYTDRYIAVDFVGKAGMSLTFDYRGVTFTEQFNGTSYSCPWFTSQAFKAMLAYENVYNRRMRVDEAIATAKMFAIDVEDKGTDVKSGYGYYEFKEGELVMEFKDQDQISKWAVGAINKAKVLGILHGDSEGNVKSKEPINLERLMVIFDKMGLLGK